MARLRREGTTLFSFSFVDILATTIGVVIFIMVMALLNISDAISSDEIEDRVAEMEKAVEESRATAEEWRKKARVARKEQEEYEAAARAADQEIAALRAARANARRARERRRGLLNRIEELKRRATTLAEEIKGIREQAGRLARVVEEGAKRRTEVAYRVPRARRTTKKPVLFECVGGRVYLMAFEQRLYEGNYRFSRILIGRGAYASVVTRRASARGESLARALSGSSRFMRTFRRTNPRTHFVDFVVRDDSFELFRGLRDAVVRKGYRYNWTPLKKDTKIVAGPGGGQQEEL